MEKLSPSLEDYLEAILVERDKSGEARVTDIANRLNVKAPSVVKAISTLAKMGFVVHERYGKVKLTEAGERKAKKVAGRHKMLKEFLVKILEIEDRAAEEQACIMEHYLSGETVSRITMLLRFVQRCSKGEPIWLVNFRRFMRGEEVPPCCGDQEEHGT